MGKPPLLSCAVLKRSKNHERTSSYKKRRAHVERRERERSGKEREIRLECEQWLLALLLFFLFFFSAAVFQSHLLSCCFLIKGSLWRTCQTRVLVRDVCALAIVLLW
jgi:hypothetical protein